MNMLITTIPFGKASLKPLLKNADFIYLIISKDVN